jgi:hypothetical protein
MRLEEICPYRWKNPDREAPSAVVFDLCREGRDPLWIQPQTQEPSRAAVF